MPSKPSSRTQSACWTGVQRPRPTPLSSGKNSGALATAVFSCAPHTGLAPAAASKPRTRSIQPPGHRKARFAISLERRFISCLRLGRPLPDAPAEGGHIDNGIVVGIKGDALGVAKRQSLQRRPVLAPVLAQPQAGIRCAFGDAQVNPVGLARVDGGAEALRAFACDSCPGDPAVGGLVEATFGALRI